MMVTITPFDHLRDMLRTHSIPLRIAFVRVLITEMCMTSSMIDRDRLTNMVVKLLDDIAQDHQ